MLLPVRESAISDLTVCSLRVRLCYIREESVEILGLCNGDFAHRVTTSGGRVCKFQDCAMVTLLSECSTSGVSVFLPVDLHLICAGAGSPGKPGATRDRVISVSNLLSAMPAGTNGLSWGSFYAFALRLRFESLHVRTDRTINANANVRLTQTYV